MRRALGLALLLLPAVVSAQTVSPVIGTTSTNPYTDDCGEGRIAALDFRSGDWMDGIMLVCEMPNGASRRFNFRGGMGGTMSSVHFQRDERLYRVLVYYRAPYILGIQIQTNRQNANLGQLAGNPIQLSSREGEIISGFQFHSGQFLQGIAIVTRPLPQAAAPAPAPAPPPPPPASSAPRSVAQEGGDGYSNLLGRWADAQHSSVYNDLPGNSGQWEGRPAQWYEYRHCRPGRTLKITATSAFDNMLYIVRSDAVQVASNNNTNGTNAELNWTCPDSQTYLIGVAAFNPASTGRYQLEIW